LLLLLQLGHNILPRIGQGAPPIAGCPGGQGGRVGHLTGDGAVWWALGLHLGPGGDSVRGLGNWSRSWCVHWLGLRPGDSVGYNILPLIDRVDRLEGGQFPQESSIPLSDGSVAMYLHQVGVEGQDLHHHTRLGPSPSLSILGSLVLDGNCVTRAEWLQCTCTMLEPLLHPAMSLGHSTGTQVSFQPPLLSWLVATD
jgi:hypothetical protein